MADKIIDIDPMESEKVQVLFERFNGFMGIITYLANSGMMQDNPFLNQKWEECAQISSELEKAKRELDIKYHPQDGINYSAFEFDFYHHQLVYHMDAEDCKACSPTMT